MAGNDIIKNEESLPVMQVSGRNDQQNGVWSMALKFRKKETKEPIQFDDDRINVLLLGNSGCGKSTLINAFLGREAAETGSGKAVTKNIGVYESDDLPFRMIDTVGYEYGLFRQYKIKKDLAKFSSDGVKNREADKLIHVIWYCIDATSKRVDQNALNYIRSVTASWRDVPVIFVITKSYSWKEMEECRKMTEEAVLTYNAKHRRNPINVQDILCVVAKEFVISDSIIVPARGLEELMRRTNELAPKAKQMAAASIERIDRRLKWDKANNIIGTSTAAAAAIGALPLPVPDAASLCTLQLNMIKRLSRTYELENEAASKEISKVIMQIGATTIAGKALVKALKARPGVNLAASVADAAAAGTITFLLGETAAIVMERFYTGEWTPDMIDMDDEIRKVFEDLRPEITEQVKRFVSDTKNNVTESSISGFLNELMPKKKKSKNS